MQFKKKNHVSGDFEKKIKEKALPIFSKLKLCVLFYKFQIPILFIQLPTRFFFKVPNSYTFIHNSYIFFFLSPNSYMCHTNFLHVPTFFIHVPIQTENHLPSLHVSYMFHICFIYETYFIYVSYMFHI